MEALLACLIGLMFAAALYLMLSGSLVKFVFGFTLIGNAVNLLIFAAGRLLHVQPPLIPPDRTGLPHAVSNALPQALILTAIVIGFALLCFALVLAAVAVLEKLRVARQTREMMDALLCEATALPRKRPAKYIYPGPCRSWNMVPCSNQRGLPAWHISDVPASNGAGSSRAGPRAV